MRDCNDVLELIKTISTKAVEANKPTNIVFGKVTSASPLKINIEQKLTLEKEQLILPKSLSDYDIEMTINGTKQKVKVHRNLKKGNEVVLFRMQGGQKYLIVDEVVKK